MLNKNDEYLELKETILKIMIDLLIKNWCKVTAIPISDVRFIIDNIQREISIMSQYLDDKEIKRIQFKLKDFYNIVVD